MRSPGLVVMAVAAAAVVGYAFYTLLESERPGPRTRAEQVAPEREGARSPPDSRPRPVVPKGVEPAAVSEVGDARRRGGPPPRPEPEVPLDVARERFAELLTELDDVKVAGRTLATSEWTDYYKRGHDALTPLLQHLDWAKPAEAEELRKANEDLRDRLHAIEPGRSDPDPP